MQKAIDIITRHAVVNYGSVLQALATEQFFRNLGYEAHTVDYIPEKESVRGRVKVFSENYTGNLFKRILYRVVKFPDEWCKERFFRRYRREMLHLTAPCHTLKDLQAHSFGEDVLCAGSDQLWGYMPDGEMDPAYFLDFGDAHNARFSYAASFGRTDFPETYYEKAVPLLRRFSFLTVREKSAEELLQAHAGLSAVTILDPTLMLDRESWLHMAEGKKPKKPYVIVYRLRQNRELDAYAKQYARQNGWRVVRISSSVYDWLGYGEKAILKTPREVLALFKNAAGVITDSFHATALSVIFNKPFVDFLPPKTQVRITDLLELLGLQDRIWREQKDPMDGVIDWERVNALLNEKRQQATAYITEQLKRTEAQRHENRM